MFDFSTKMDFYDLPSNTFTPPVEPVEGASSASGAVFRVRGKEVFVSRRWQSWNGSFWCIIDLTSPLTGYVEKRSGGIIQKLMKNEDRTKILLMPEDEEVLFKYFSLIVEKEIHSLQKQYPFHFKVEIIRLYQPVEQDYKAIERTRAACFA